MCISHDEYQLINPNTQVSLYSDCNCSSNKTIQWNIKLNEEKLPIIKN